MRAPVAALAALVTLSPVARAAAADGPAPAGESAANVGARPSVSAQAEALYEEGKRLLAAGRSQEACTKLEASQSLEPAIGTQFNLADCYERVGRLASALALFQDVARIAQLTGKAERNKAALERVAALEQRVARLKLTAKAPRGEQRLRVDGREVTGTEAGVPVDAGQHVVRAEAPGAAPYEVTVTAPDGGASLEVVIPPLADATREVVREVSIEKPTVQKPIAIGLVAAGVVGLGVGAVMGVRAMGLKKDAGCDGTDCSKRPPESADKLTDAQGAGTLSTIAFIVGGAFTAAGVTLWLTAPSGRRVGMTPSRGGAMLTWEGTL